MAFFKFRKRGDATASASTSNQAPPAESVEAIRKRARQRLIGAAVLVLAGVVGFPLVFDTQPRPIAVDIPIDIPDRAKARPLAPVQAPAASAAAGTVAADAATAAPAAAVKADAVSAPAAPAPAAAPVPAAVPVPLTTPVAPAASAPRADADRAKALLEDKDAQAAGEGRFVVQVGAFADAAKAAAVRQKLEKAGLKTYTHVADTKEGKRIRVRLGPFSSKADAEKAAAKAKGLDLQASVLTL